MTLLVSIHDVAPPHLAVCQRLRQALDRWGVSPVTLLVVPDFHGAHPLERSPETLAWLRARAAAGDEIALHGYTHRQDAPIDRPLDRLRAALFTAGEGECLAQPAPDRLPRLEAGKRLLERQLQVEVTGFVAPAWLEPAGFETALAAAGFHWHETSLWVAHRDPESPTWRRRRAPVIGFATRTLARRLAALAWARALEPLLAARIGGAPARVALHPADLGSPAVERALEGVIRRLGAHLAPATYARALP